MTIKLEMLRAFCAVAEAGNLSDAAVQLGRTQSAVSMTLKGLEAHLGRPLFESDRKNRLTLLGQQVLHLSQSQVRSFDTTVQSIDLLAQAPQGVLKVAAVPSLAALVFPKLVRALSRAYPGIKLELRDTDTPQVIDALSSGWADLGIASATQPIKGVTAVELFSDAFGLVMSATHPMALKQGPLTLADVFDAEFIRNELCDQIQLSKFRSQLSNVGLTVRNLQSLLAMLREGDWVSVLPPSVVPLGGDGLVFRDIEELTERRKVFLLRRSDVAFPDIVETAHSEISKMWVEA
ncbi:LysR family transcriptional regulator [Cognatishimia activa]|uniref:LysR family transcriptional regulator n=1 Tax=Cognatishimia activa TaxID=1715691 RepID=A0A975ERG8_9RHOB|nr:LysR family transcriptional regulator [Cognatishimia activa]QTN36854.1 LysR family transcriptional regulator [Cognatishimia activa]